MAKIYIYSAGTIKTVVYNWLTLHNIIGNMHACMHAYHGCRCTRCYIAYLPTCLKQKAGQTSWKSGTFGLKALQIWQKLLTMIEFSDKFIISAPQTSRKMWDREKAGQQQFWTKNQDCPSKSSTVGKYASIASWCMCTYGVSDTQIRPLILWA